MHMTSMHQVCRQLDGLSHFHFAPKPVVLEPRVQGLGPEKALPSLSLEDLIPTTENSATVLAPEEVRHSFFPLYCSILPTYCLRPNFHLDLILFHSILTSPTIPLNPYHYLYHPSLSAHPHPPYLISSYLHSSSHSDQGSQERQSGCPRC